MYPNPPLLLSLFQNDKKDGFSHKIPPHFNDDVTLFAIFLSRRP